MNKCTSHRTHYVFAVAVAVAIEFSHVHMVPNSTVKFENYINGLHTVGMIQYIYLCGLTFACARLCVCLCVSAVYALKRFLQYCNKTSIIAFYWQMPKVLDNDRDDVDDVERI